jgi:hypothetical protein
MLTPPKDQEEMSNWLNYLFPNITPAMYDQDGCWVAFMKTRETAHNPPFSWMARAFTSSEKSGEIQNLQTRLFNEHGSDSCGGDKIRDNAVQLVISQTCASAWSREAFGIKTLSSTRGYALEEPAANCWIIGENNENKIAINVIRLTPVRQLSEVHQQIYKYVEATSQNRPTDTSLVIMYFDIWFDGPTYAYDLGYNLDVTQPVIDVLKSFASAADLGYVLTRPFQWGNPVAEWY